MCSLFVSFFRNLRLKNKFHISIAKFWPLQVCIEISSVLRFVTEKLYILFFGLMIKIHPLLNIIPNLPAQLNSLVIQILFQICE